ncbi:hypothetical protein H9P43_007086 [Blastocladiella emersonii ATCC 22665]|nr:hypothetical protein H9P43_007086 [Blastocladiella emersonii ATCC 22665]
MSQSSRVYPAKKTTHAGPGTAAVPAGVAPGQVSALTKLGHAQAHAQGLGKPNPRGKRLGPIASIPPPSASSSSAAAAAEDPAADTEPLDLHALFPGDLVWYRLKVPPSGKSLMVPATVKAVAPLVTRLELDSPCFGDSGTVTLNERRLLRHYYVLPAAKPGDPGTDQLRTYEATLRNSVKTAKPETMRIARAGVKLLNSIASGSASSGTSAPAKVLGNIIAPPPRPGSSGTSDQFALPSTKISDAAKDRYRTETKAKGAAAPSKAAAAAVGASTSSSKRASAPAPAPKKPDPADTWVADAGFKSKLSDSDLSSDDELVKPPKRAPAAAPPKSRRSAGGTPIESPAETAARGASRAQSAANSPKPLPPAPPSLRPPSPVAPRDPPSPKRATIKTVRMAKRARTSPSDLGLNIDLPAAALSQDSLADLGSVVASDDDSDDAGGEHARAAAAQWLALGDPALARRGASPLHVPARILARTPATGSVRVRYFDGVDADLDRAAVRVIGDRGFRDVPVARPPAPPRPDPRYRNPVLEARLAAVLPAVDGVLQGERASARFAMYRQLGRRSQNELAGLSGYNPYSRNEYALVRRVLEWRYLGTPFEDEDGVVAVMPPSSQQQAPPSVDVPMQEEEPITVSGPSSPVLSDLSDLDDPAPADAAAGRRKSKHKATYVHSSSSSSSSSSDDSDRDDYDPRPVQQSKARSKKPSPTTTSAPAPITAVAGKSNSKKKTKPAASAASGEPTLADLDPPLRSPTRSTAVAAHAARLAPLATLFPRPDAAALRVSDRRLFDFVIVPETVLRLVVLSHGLADAAAAAEPTPGAVAAVDAGKKAGKKRGRDDDKKKAAAVVADPAFVSALSADSDSDASSSSASSSLSSAPGSSPPPPAPAAAPTSTISRADRLLALTAQYAYDSEHWNDLDAWHAAGAPVPYPAAYTVSPAAERAVIPLAEAVYKDAAWVHGIVELHRTTRQHGSGRR